MMIDAVILMPLLDGAFMHISDAVTPLLHRCLGLLTWALFGPFPCALVGRFPWAFWALLLGPCWALPLGPWGLQPMPLSGTLNISCLPTNSGCPWGPFCAETSQVINQLHGHISSGQRVWFERLLSGSECLG